MVPPSSKSGVLLAASQPNDERQTTKSTPTPRVFGYPHGQTGGGNMARQQVGGVSVESMSATATAARSSGRLRRSSSSPRRQRPRTAFVLSGGASLGALQVGMLRALYERGVVPDLLVGTSAGAVNAAFVASRPQTPSTADELARIWRRLERQDVFPVSARALIGGAMGHRDHLFPDHGLRQLVRRHLQIELLEESRVSLHLVAFDLTSGKRCASRAVPP